MHVLLGWISFAGVLALTLALEKSSGFTGLFHPPALVLVGLGPPAIALIAFPLSELRAAFIQLRAALRPSTRNPRAVHFKALLAFATALRQRKLADALSVAEGAL